MSKKNTNQEKEKVQENSIEEKTPLVAYARKNAPKKRG